MKGGKLLILGAGGHGRVVADTAAASGEWDEIAFLDDGHPGIFRAGDWEVVGRFSVLESLAQQFEACVPAVGQAVMRLDLLKRARLAGFALPAIIHPRAIVSSRARIDAGCVVVGGAVINIGCAIGEACIVNTGATVDHDCDLAEGVHVCPGAHLAGNVALGARTWFGIGAVARQGVRIGADVTVGAGTVVIRDIGNGTTVVGNPARVLRND